MRFSPLLLLLLLAACSENKPTENTMNAPSAPAKNFTEDLAFLRKHHADLVTLSTPDSSAQLVIVPAYQARVMTSTARGGTGAGYGWINYELIDSRQLQPHINAFGGEERFWLGPEGGQYSLFFKPGDPQDFDHWQTPAVIDTEKWPLAARSESNAIFEKDIALTNYANAALTMRVRREITLLPAGEISNQLNVSLPQGISAVAYATDNRITNTGTAAWNKDSGLPSIWLLGMFNPAPGTVVMVPFREGKDLSSHLTDDYFGKVPADRIKFLSNALLFSADGKHRSKLGLTPEAAQPIAGSFDVDQNILTIIQYELHPDGDYVKSTWEMHDAPYKGDAVNTYNDGPNESGGQLGPFYELESSSNVLPLAPGESLSHRQITAHFEGDFAGLNALSQQLLGVSLEEVKTFLKK